MTLDVAVNNETFAQFRSRSVRRIEDVLETLLPPAHLLPARLHDAMRYSTLGGGKRVRPLLVYAAGACLGVPLELLDRPAAALEMIHAYSLVHDDLPAMDNDDLRRGLPTCHRAYDEATAILVGDGLQAQAFLVLAEPGWGMAAERQVQMLASLAQAAGSRGMVGGQAIDLAAVGHELALPALEQMHLHKTGMLMRCAIQLALCAAGIDAQEARGAALLRYADRVGLAFQVQDDILDEIGDLQQTGKAQQGADRSRNKPSFITLLGLAEARSYARRLLDEALDALQSWQAEADHLRALARLIIERSK
ncbi:MULTISPECIES: farnesyl diphosphate synthase [Acidithiobacillus]|jgi:farnesyl diphosphate synthase|uniref:Geranyltranstransferase n=3 Tax=root TaxID=1 RepID=B7JC70_ACIF2|nr:MULTISPECIES: farnesyl diphosphate synthase [Acidithiobacillus]MCL5957056.1 polyprenyl synthetase family protein [Gammaproteobacteria bacterium]ACH83865.1 Polyprenyl synthetase [Acidithiobacillus ferrooxidans ATCC 53993]ACK78194.1 geranyltranstransferase [Acidithiobacillus ferrooxidans ATCC 23270]MBN6743731.1 polyprenyl synthetase family protein [Acidithiobacillus sp. MC2.2]MBN6746588.1 polyprenyl synthetase family protein [Acidithiobacillus sp. PG05]